MTKNNSPLLEAALGYARMGIPVFPCAPGRKKPITENGFHAASTDEAVIRQWWADNPRANIGMPTGAASGNIVIDIDPRHGGHVSLDVLTEEHGDLPDTPESATSGGGRHFYFQHPGRHVPCSQGVIAPGVDVKGDGGYVMLPPSVHPSGDTYTWELSSVLGEVSPVLPPQWLLAKLGQADAPSPQGPTCGESGESSDGNAIPDGQRNNALASLAGSMRRNGMGRDEILAALLVTNSNRCVPPLSEKEVQRIADSVSRYQPDAVSVALVENHYEQQFEQEEDTPAENIPDPGPVPKALLRVPGFIDEVMDYTLATAPYPNVGLAFCGAMALQSFLAGRKVCTSGDLRTNLYLLALASSGTGKDFPRKVNSRVLFDIGLVNAVGDKFASGEGIQDALVRSNAMLFQNDEMDGVLRQINLDRENRRESIPNILLTLYTSANDVYPIRVKAGQKEAMHIDQPHLTLFGTATPQYFYESLSQRMLTNGFFARMMIVDVGRRGPGQTPGSVRNIPQSIMKTARWWAEYQPGRRNANLLTMHPEPRVVPFASDAVDAIARLQRMAEAEYNQAEESNNEVARTAWSRTCENASKLALIYACSVNHEDPEIDLTAVEWASAFAMHQTRRQLYMATQYVAENPFHAECLKLIRKLNEAGGQMKRRKLMRAMRCKAGEFDQIIITLIQQGDIIPVEIPTKTKPAQGYRVAE